MIELCKFGALSRANAICLGGVGEAELHRCIH